MIDKKDLYGAGVFGRPHGVKGEIALVTSGRLSGLDESPYFFCEMEGILVPFFIESFRTKSVNSVLVKFEDVDSEEEVKIFTGKTAYIYAALVKENDKPAAPTFTGYQVIDESMSFRGVVTDMDDSTANTLLRVDSAGKDIIIPLAFLQRVSEQTIYIKLPEKFMDICDE